MKVIIFSSELIQLVCEDARCKYPEECCGVLLGEREKTGCRVVKKVLPADNKAEDGLRQRSFLIGQEDILRAERTALQAGYEVVGFYHSHVDCAACASEEDGRYSIPGISYPIVSIRGISGGRWENESEELSSWEKFRAADGERMAEETIVVKD
jgi:proteasome lid subunit RPN8/RPN11